MLGSLNAFPGTGESNLAISQAGKALGAEVSILAL